MSGLAIETPFFKQYCFVIILLSIIINYNLFHLCVDDAAQQVL